jgi:hypothetical protein
MRGVLGVGPNGGPEHPDAIAEDRDKVWSVVRHARVCIGVEDLRCMIYDWFSDVRPMNIRSNLISNLDGSRNAEEKHT